MSLKYLSGVAVVAALVSGFAACGGDDCKDFPNLCQYAASDGGEGGTGDGALADGMSGGDGSLPTDGGGTVDAPPGCDLKADPKDSPACVADAVGVFVDAAGGLDTNDGSKAKPYQTIAKALTANASAKPRIYVCAGSYTDNVTVDQAHSASIYGGFACGAWSYATSNAVTVKPTSGYALEVDSVTSAVTIADVELDAPDGSAASVHSIAAFVHDSPSVTLKRAKLVAGTGFSPGKAGDPAANYSGMNASAGVTAPNAVGGQLVAGACTCTDGTNARGGNGGGAAAAVAGVPPLGAGSAGLNGVTCGGGGTSATADGNNATALLATSAPAKAGTLSASGWVASSGAKGANGTPGQGGGGGGNGKGGNGGGGSGACGGCGGSGGLGGAGGGASIAILTFSAPVSLVTSTLTSGKAGDGATGSDAQGGQAGGGPGGAGFLAMGQPGTNVGCSGGAGGAGAGGNGGGGGAAGVSFAVLSSGAVPTKDSSTTLNAGATGAVGIGGKAGDTGLGANNSGQPGAPGPTTAAAAQKRVEDL